MAQAPICKYTLKGWQHDDYSRLRCARAPKKYTLIHSKRKAMYVPGLTYVQNRFSARGLVQLYPLIFFSLLFFACQCDCVFSSSSGFIIFVATDAPCLYAHRFEDILRTRNTWAHVMSGHKLRVDDTCADKRVTQEVYTIHIHSTITRA